MRQIGNPRWSVRPPSPGEVDWSSQAWRQHPQARGLYAWWPTLAGTGSRLREMVRGRDAIGYNGTAVGASAVTGQAITNFAGNASQRYYRSPLAWPGGPVTVSFWLWVASGAGGCLFGDDTYWAGGGYKRFCGLAPGTDGKLWWYYGDIALAPEFYADYSPHFGSWTLVTLSSTAAANTFQGISFNGQLAASTSSSNDCSASTYFDIGRSVLTGTDRYFTGQVADFRIYNRVLSAAEAWQLWAPQTRWQLPPVRPTRRWFLPSSPSSTIFRRTFANVFRSGSRSVA